MRTLALALLASLVSPAAADEVTGFVTGGTGELTGIATDLDGKPLEGIKVHIVGKSGAEQIVTTDAKGKYRAKVATESYVFVEGKVKIGGQVAATVTEGGMEAIEIREQIPPAVQPKSLTPLDTVLDYSDTAADKNTWTRAWLMLHVNDAGKVVRVKLLNKPGLDLDAIAIREAFKVKFEPARDLSNKKIPAMVVWTWEWPAYYWMLDHKRNIHRLPPEVVRVMCRGAGAARVLRDCSKPTIANAVSQAWIAAPP